ncbi:M23 family metallopeptidase [Prauserella alba]|uniref:M23ase beta-sheet core domain-containing protein n=1 Tax=Prauserella alba TaxID=176898 RepID=A0ABN1VH82_9PSEU|nr:M23 family metallopeptidase [Prauserella alba]MCP2182771.1 Murein DD-endopeptidase MepM and murein hydrolase activator NlpD, containing LysM domain [Prauserella alba]
MSAPHALSRAAAVTLATLALVAAPTTPAHGQESPDDLEAARTELSQAQAALAQTYQRYGDAQRKHERTQQAATQARERAEQARGAAEKAAARVRGMRGDVDRFASASFRQGSTVGSISAYLGAESTTEMLERSSLLNAISDDQLSILDRMRAALDKRRASQHDATAALREASSNEQAAESAKTEAQRAFRAAKAKKQEAQSEIDRLSAATAEVSTGGAAKPAEGELTSGYGARWGTVHYGIDIANSIGTPIHSTLPGEVIDAGPASGFGMWVRVQHSDGLISVYGHIDEATVSVGQQVAAGEQIATMGNRGQSTGPHLHFEIHENGNKIDPLPWLRSRGVDI